MVKADTYLTVQQRVYTYIALPLHLRSTVDANRLDSVH